MSIQHSTVDFDARLIHLHPDAWPRVEAILRNDPLAVAIAVTPDVRQYKFAHIDAGANFGGLVTMRFVTGHESIGRYPIFQASTVTVIGAFWNYLYRRYYNTLNAEDALSMALNCPMIPNHEGGQ